MGLTGNAAGKRRRRHAETSLALGPAQELRAHEAQWLGLARFGGGETTGEVMSLQVEPKSGGLRNADSLSSAPLWSGAVRQVVADLAHGLPPAADLRVVGQPGAYRVRVQTLELSECGLELLPRTGGGVESVGPYAL